MQKKKKNTNMNKIQQKTRLHVYWFHSSAWTSRQKSKSQVKAE